MTSRRTVVYSCTAAMNMVELSAYAQKLPAHAQKRYREKLSAMGNVDPFRLFRDPPMIPIQRCSLPLVNASDLVSYLVLQTSSVTLKQFKSYRSLESYNQFVNGWVKDVKGYKIADKIVVIARVSCLNTKLLHITFTPAMYDIG